MSTIIKTLDNVYAVRLVNLLRKPFKEWKAFELGIIDENGQLIKRPKTKEEQLAYSPFHASVRPIKRMLNTIPTANTIMALSGAYSAFASKYGLNERDLRCINESTELGTFLLNEDAMVAGDAGGDPTAISSGNLSGAITTNGAGGVKKKRKKYLTRA